ncbi:MAG TPA: hypothetical protein DD490_05485 [Acidobacteria bacterium]|nr:hypothetical protein [Acidobacteriota bacterium]
MGEPRSFFTEKGVLQRRLCCIPQDKFKDFSRVSWRTVSKARNLVFGSAEFKLRPPAASQEPCLGGFFL